MNSSHPPDACAVLAALGFLTIIGVVFCGLLWFGSLWAAHQDDHEEWTRPKEACQ